MTEITSAVIAAITSLIVAGITAWVTVSAQKERLRIELRTEFMIEEAIKRLLSHPKWKKRTFDKIKEKIGVFNDDNELRKMLVRSGAVRFYSKSENEGKETEYWGLIDKNKDELDT